MSSFYNLKKNTIIFSKNSQVRILFISHEASLTGAPLVLLYFLRWLKKNTNTNFDVLLIKGGPLEIEFEKVANKLLFINPSIFLKNNQKSQKSISKKVFERIHMQIHSYKNNQLIKQTTKVPYICVYGNTIATLPVLNKFSSRTKKIIHIHELPFKISNYFDKNWFVKSIKKINKVIGVSKLVVNNLIMEFNIPASKIELVYEFVPNHIKSVQKESINNIKSKLGIPYDSFIVGGSGTITWRKGVDLFIQVASILKQKEVKKKIYFVWVGDTLDSTYFKQLNYDIKKGKLENRIKFTGVVINPLDYFNIFNIFLMTSREDPFPLVCIENAQLEKPIICFKGATGSQEFLPQDKGCTIDYLDTNAMAKSALDFYKYPEKCKVVGAILKDATKKFTVEKSSDKILTIIHSLNDVD